MAKKAKATAIPMTVYSTGVDRMHCSPAWRSPNNVAFWAGALNGKSLINSRNTIPTRYSPALTISVGPIPTSSIIPPAIAGPMICPV